MKNQQKVVRKGCFVCGNDGIFTWQRVPVYNREEPFCSTCFIKFGSIDKFTDGKLGHY